MTCVAIFAISPASNCEQIFISLWVFIIEIIQANNIHMKARYICFVNNNAEIKS